MNGHEVSSSFWNEEGLIPPVKDPIGRDRSPYRMPLSDFVEEFGGAGCAVTCCPILWTFEQPCMRPDW